VLSTTSFRGNNLQTVEEVKFILQILLKEISECPNKQKHIEGLRHAIINEDIVASVSEEQEHAAREELLK
jgi:hypothetical protein